MDKLPINQIVLGDCINVMKIFPGDSVDCIVTDPPYGMSFMGKEWDRALPPREAFEQMLRVLKPGALAFVMSSPRQDLVWRMMRLLEEAGFQMKQSFISWVYKTGFPKAYDVSKGIDQKLGKDPKIIGMGKSGRPSSHKSSLNMKRDIDNAGYEFGGEFDITAPASDEARRWEGWKSITGLKPALEPILMVNKPLSEKTIVDNVLRWGTGAINVDACRIPFESEDNIIAKNPHTKSKGTDAYNTVCYGKYNPVETPIDYTKSKGRFPANLLVSDGALDTGETSKSSGGSGKATLKSIDRTDIGYGFKEIDNPSGLGGYGDVGDQSRYFDLDAWAEHHGILDVSKPSKSERDRGLTNTPREVYRAGHGNKEEDDVTKRFRTLAKNTHPTVKPIKLMAYLIELGCPPNGIVLDPFVGSGTTCIAAKQLSRKYIGIELDADYVEIAEKRLVATPTRLPSF